MKVIYVNYANAFIVIISAYLHGVVTLRTLTNDEWIFKFFKVI